MFLPLRDDNPHQHPPIVTIGLIVINVLTQIYQSSMSLERAGLFLASAGAIPFEITRLTDIVRFPDQPVALVPIPLTILTSMFVHGGWLHLLSNMWYLWLFGDNVEDSMGHLRFVLFYLLCGLIAASAQIAADPSSTTPMVGASGAIAGILGAYLLKFPRARVRCLLFIIIIVQFIDVPAFIILGFWFLMQLLNGLGSAAGAAGGVAWFAHIGGFVAGLALINFFARRRQSEL